MQSNNHPLFSFDDLHQSRDRVVILANCGIRIPYSSSIIEFFLSSQPSLFNVRVTFDRMGENRKNFVKIDFTPLQTKSQNNIALAKNRCAHYLI